MISHFLKDSDETHAFGRKLAKELQPGDVVSLRGTLGAGKTTLAQGICQGLGVEESVTSPTYSLICEYQGTLPVYHMDVYRLEGEEDFESTGGLEYLDGQGVCLVEWSEKISKLLPSHTIYVELTWEGTGRRITVTGGR